MPPNIPANRYLYVIDDDIDVRKSLNLVLVTSHITTWPFASPTDFLAQLDTLKPAPVLLDFRMPDLDGLQLLRILREREIFWPVIMMSAHGQIPIAVRAMQLGAIDFLEKPYQIEDLERLLESSFNMLDEIRLEAESRNEAKSKLEKLTPREREVLLLLARGFPNKVVADDLGISPRTIEVHRRQLYEKMGAKSSVELLATLHAAGVDLKMSE